LKLSLDSYEFVIMGCPLWQRGWACNLQFRHPQVKVKLYYDRRSISQPVSLSGTHLGPATNFSYLF
jgi:hypothetical protein